MGRKPKSPKGEKPKREKSEFSGWLEKQFLKWQYNQGTRRTVNDFARWIGISPSLLHHWLSGHRTPTRVTALKVALRIGPEVYDLLDMEKPDLDLEKINEVWPQLPQKTKTSIMKVIESAISDQ